jgi:tetratricopeptide (TPR) repeat protein
VYKKVHNDKHYVISIALSNIAGVLQERKQYPQAEALFREAIQRYETTLTTRHQLMGIAKARLGRVLRLEGRWADALKETKDGYDILMGQTTPSVFWAGRAASDLIMEYDSLGRPADAAKIRADSAALAATK